MGIALYQNGEYTEALTDFRKVLLINPANKIAKDYISRIVAKQGRPLKETIFKKEGQFSTPGTTPSKYKSISQSVFYKIKLTPQEYLGLVKRKIYSYMTYPEEATANKWQGVTVINLTIKRDGSLKKARIAKSSGYPLLDETAISAVKKAGPYPSLAYYPESPAELEIVLPVNFGGIEPAPPEPKKEPAPIPLPQPFSEEEIIAPQETPLSDKEFLPPKVSEQLKPMPTRKLNTVEDFIELAVENNQPTQIARQEIKLAKMKVTEAERNLYPAVKLTSYDTQGEVYKVGYTEREIKAQLDQPILYGGRLINSLKQAKVNLEITERNYDRQKIDIAHKADVAYYNLAGSSINLKAQEEISAEANKLLSVVKKQVEGGLIIPLDYASAKSWHEQINFQIDSTKHDMAMAKLALAQVLNIPEAPELSQPEIEIKELGLSLNDCLEIGAKNRPEIYLSGLLVKFNKYAKKIEDGKNRLAVQLTSSYGSYQGAYETESMKHSDNWYIGFKATKPFGASSINSAVTSESSQPRFGQSSPTKASTVSAEINILDSLQLNSDRKKAEIELQRAESDLNETAKTVNYEIKDAYLNCQKALLQATTARSETEYRHREVENFKIRAQVGETGFSNVIESLVGLSRAQTNYAQAMANYFIAVANLKKATGYGIKI